MKTPIDKYQEDNNFRSLVDMMTSYIVNCEFTPSEMRQASILASIRYEQMRIRPIIIPRTRKLEEALKIMHEFETGDGS